MKLRLLVASICAALVAFHPQPADAQPVQSTNAASPGCSIAASGHLYYCTPALVYVNGQWDGYIGFYFIVQNGIVTGGSVFREDVHGNVIFSASDVWGTFDADGLNITFLQGAGSAVEKFGAKQSHCYKGTCRNVIYITGGSGTF